MGGFLGGGTQALQGRADNRFRAITRPRFGPPAGNCRVGGSFVSQSIKCKDTKPLLARIFLANHKRFVWQIHKNHMNDNPPKAPDSTPIIRTNRLHARKWEAFYTSLVKDFTFS